MKYEHILWCKEDNHDKVWGIIRLQDNIPWDTPYHATFDYVTFWGRRGKKLQTKCWAGRPNDVGEMAYKKLDKGYKEVDKTQLDIVYPEFEQDLEKTAVWAMLGV